ncbi:hypothetical protein VTH06DRAFT_8178 [Thermothelomyces fergusii]
MVPLRAALAHLCAVALPWLALNEGFAEALATEWMPGLWANVVGDAVWFGAHGLRGDRWAVLEEAIAPSEDKDRAPGGDGPQPASRSKKRRRDADADAEGEEPPQQSSSSSSPGDFEIWRDGHGEEPGPPPRWRRPQPRDEMDDRMIDGERLTAEQQREVSRENLLAPAERGGGSRPRGGVGRGMLQRRHNFTDPGLRPPGHEPDGDGARERRGDDSGVRNAAGHARPRHGADGVLRNMALLR